MLAGKLLKNVSYDTSREVATLELLKLRFGEAAMHHCEIMVRQATYTGVRARRHYSIVRPG